MDVQLATAVGATDTALLETTIDENFRATVAAHSDREALVVRHQGIRWTYDELDTRVDELARALLAGLPGVSVRAVHGRTLALHPGDHAPAAINRSLVEGGVEVGRLAPARRGLTEVFEELVLEGGQPGAREEAA